MSRNVLEVINVSKKFGTIKALENVSLNIGEGEVVALLGPNGAGKSTLMRCVTSLSKPDQVGSIKIVGKILDNKIKRQIGVCPQEMNLYEDSTGLETLLLQGYLLRIPRKDRLPLALELLDLVGLVDRKDDLVSKYSGGMKRRLQIARALVGEPKLLILDEPTVGLSPVDRSHIWEKIRTLQNQGISILFTTHYMEEADALANRVYIIDHGTIIKCGSPESLKQSLEVDTIVHIISEDPNVFHYLEKQGYTVLATQKKEIIVKITNGSFNTLFNMLEGFKIEEMSVKRPSLEDVFLALTGSTLITREVIA